MLCNAITYVMYLNTDANQRMSNQKCLLIPHYCIDAIMRHYPVHHSTQSAYKQRPELVDSRSPLLSFTPFQCIHDNRLFCLHCVRLFIDVLHV